MLKMKKDKSWKRECKAEEASTAGRSWSSKSGAIVARAEVRLEVIASSVSTRI